MGCIIISLFERTLVDYVEFRKSKGQPLPCNGTMIEIQWRERRVKLESEMSIGPNVVLDNIFTILTAQCHNLSIVIQLQFLWD